MIADVLCQRGYRIHCVLVQEQDIEVEVYLDGEKMHVKVYDVDLGAFEEFELSRLINKIYDIYPELLLKTLTPPT